MIDFVPNRNPILHPDMHGHNIIDYYGNKYTVIHTHPHRDSHWLPSPLPHIHVYPVCGGQQRIFNALIHGHSEITLQTNPYEYGDENMADIYIYPFLS